MKFILNEQHTLKKNLFSGNVLVDRELSMSTQKYNEISKYLFSKITNTMFRIYLLDTDMGFQFEDRWIILGDEGKDDKLQRLFDKAQKNVVNLVKPQINDIKNKFKLTDDEIDDFIDYWLKNNKLLPDRTEMLDAIEEFSKSEDILDNDPEEKDEDLSSAVDSFANGLGNGVGTAAAGAAMAALLK